MGRPSVVIVIMLLLLISAGFLSKSKSMISQGELGFGASGSEGGPLATMAQAAGLNH